MRRIIFDMLIASAFALPVLIYKILNPANVNPSLTLVLTLLIFSPVAEEIFFRGVLLEFLLRKNVYWIMGNITVSAVFALAHVAARQNFAAAWVFFPSLVLGWLYYRHRRVIPVIAIHSFYNILVLI